MELKKIIFKYCDNGNDRVTISSLVIGVFFMMYVSSIVFMYLYCMLLVPISLYHGYVLNETICSEMAFGAIMGLPGFCIIGLFVYSMFDKITLMKVA